MFESLSRKVRASEMRIAAIECARKGYDTIAAVNNEMADWIDPAPKERAGRGAPRKADPAADIIPIGRPRPSRVPRLKVNVRPTRIAA